MIGLAFLNQKHRAGCLPQKFPVGVGEHPARHMLARMALCDNQVRLGFQGAANDGFRRWIVPLGSTGDTNFVFTQAFGNTLQASDCIM